MKKFFTLMAAVLLMGTFALNANADNKKKIEEVTFVTTIDCKNCAKKIEANLPHEQGIKDMKVTVADKTVWIKYDASKTDKAKLAAAIKKLGYEATEKTAK